MEFQINTNNVILIQHDQVESGEYNVTECTFNFSNEYDGLTKKAVFTGEDGTAYLETIVDNKCPIPSEILEVSQVVEIGVYAYDVENEELVLRYSPEPTQFYIHQGSYKEAQNSTPPTPSEIEQLQAQITTNANNIEELTGDVVDINQDIADIKAEQITQNENIQTNTDNISTINGQITAINQDIDNLERTKADKSEIPTKTSDLINDSDFVSDSEYVHTDNNFTDEDKAQITTNKNDIATLQSTKADKSEIPTKTSDLTNDSGYITKNVDDLANYYKKSETYNKTEIDGKVSSVYKYKGTVATYEDLPSTDLTIGDVYNVEEDGSNYAWTGNSWDKLGGDIDLSEYYTKTQTDSLLSAKANSSDVYNKTETYNKTEVNTLLDDKVDKVQGKGLSTNDFTDSYKNQIEANQTAITNIKDGTAIDSFGDVETALNDKEDKSNKVTELTDESTNTQYPSAKCVYDELEAKQSEIDTLQQDVEDLRGACLSVEGTGTDIILNNTASAKILDIELKGQTSQVQLTGRNLYNNANIIGSSGTIDNDGWITCNFENTGSTTQYVNFFTTLNELLQENTNYNIFIEIKSKTGNFTNFSISDRGQFESGYGFILSNNEAVAGLVKQQVTRTIDDFTGITYGLRTFIEVAPGQSGSLVFRISILADTSVRPTNFVYEKFCGGIPSPNPDYPQQIKNVTGNANVKIQNRNLLNSLTKTQGYPSNTASAPSTTRLFTENTYVLGIATNNYYAPSSVSIDKHNEDEWEFKTIYSGYGISFPINFARNGSYRLSYEKKGNVNSALLKYDKTGNFIEGVFNNVFETDKNFNYLLVFYTSTTNETVGFSKVQIEEGSTATSYVPHQEQNFPFTFAEGQRAMQGTTLEDDGIHNTRKQIEITAENVDSLVSNISTTFNILAAIISKKDLGYENTWLSGIALINNYHEIKASGDEESGSFATNFNRFNLYIFDDRFTDLETAKSLLIGTIIEIEQAEPEIIPYNETQQAQYNAIKQARSYDDQTNISSTSDELGFDMNVVAVADANKVIDSLDTRLLALESEV